MTARAERFRRALQAGFSIHTAAIHAGFTRKWAGTMAVRLGYAPPGRGPVRNDALRRAIVEGYANHTSPAEIAAAAGSTPGSVRAMAVRLGVSRRPAEAAHPRRKVDIPPELAEDFALFRRKGIPICDAARALGVQPRSSRGK